ncbi:MAG: NUDIX hydrolase [Candidatus Poseidoniaceae archaeon]|nr:NUDIX hydrolase [Candidatus Poseidoniaceae archaeon]
MVVCDECNGWLNPALAADSAVRRGDEVLLIQRKFPPMAGAWAFPGGFVERGEDPMHAALRELKEETGMDGSDASLLMVMGDPERDPRKHIVSVVYEIQVDDEQQPVAGDDAADARFWPIEVLLSGEVEFAGDHLTILKNWLNR